MPLEKIRLHTYALSPFAAKVHCFLGFKQLEFESVYIHPFRVREELPLGEQIPVLTIGDEARNDSTPIGVWLDERYPEHSRLLPLEEDARARVLSIDRWVTQTLIPVAFRIMLAVGESLGAKVRNRSRGARVLNTTVSGGIPAWLRTLYPLVITRPPFIQKLIHATDGSLSTDQLLAQTFDEFDEHLGQGPFLGEQVDPTLADLSAYAQFALTYLAGYDRADAFAGDERILVWFQRMTRRLDGMPPLLPEALAERSLADLSSAVE